MCIADANGKMCRGKAIYGEYKDNNTNRLLGSYCELHKTPNMKSVYAKLCVEVDCINLAEFSKLNNTNRYCLEHATSEMRNVKNRECKCGFRASYNFEGLEPEYCKSCTFTKKDEITGEILRMELIGATKCKECKTQACFGIIDKYGNKQITHCYQHKTQNMINLRAKRCTYDGCNTFATYGCFIDNKKQVLYCAKHAPDDMKNVVTKMCVWECDGIRCDKHPTFGQIIDGKKVIEYCATHAPEDTSDIKNKRCEFVDDTGIRCEIHPHFGNKGEQPKFCKQHSSEEMINLNKQKCTHEGCETEAHKGFEGGKRLYCSKHAKEGMIDLVNSLCKEEKCYKRPTFNYKGLKAEYCLKHASKGMIDVINLRCLNKEYCDLIVIDKRYDGYCFRCYMEKYPDTILACNYRVKEFAVVEYVKKTLKHEFTLNKKIIGGNSKRRPDIALELDTHVIIIEVDENQHDNYSKDYNKIRDEELWLDYNKKPIVFIRFNPDEYKIGDKKCSGCFTKGSKKDICRLNNNMVNQWSIRLETLKTTFEYYLDKDKLKSDINEHLLFYNE
jgi:hypothetical protein